MFNLIIRNWDTAYGCLIGIGDFVFEFCVSRPVAHCKTAMDFWFILVLWREKVDKLFFSIDKVCV